MYICRYLYQWRRQIWLPAPIITSAIILRSRIMPCGKNLIHFEWTHKKLLCTCGAPSTPRGYAGVLSTPLYSRCTCLKKMYWASKIEWPVSRRSRDKKKKTKGCFERVRLCALRGGQKVLTVVTICPWRNRGVLFKKKLNSGNFLTLTVLDLLNLAREDGWLSGIHIKKNKEENKQG